MVNGEEYFLDILASMLDSVLEKMPPLTVGRLTAKEPPSMQQQRSCRPPVESLIIGKQHGLTLPDNAPRRRVEALKHSISTLGPNIPRSLHATSLWCLAFDVEKSFTRKSSDLHHIKFL
ncbi:uncharacterized protein ARB_06190 [Trichophyton benhamiae CBS 112371]|uniref:Uncharacterized protein n=1 Tax=Arthroderma benhamiae (strain ATCC MYA-4681 / CBS 112371) TaxID=663331 RepID=D4APM2_ARTBC|nr:uncharacterized protein ARB_06190 [Trichophyton benhamiae CBS 112371]EFE35233.1 hypothetical protein ARB_06190 [Trichophyton benhamiae CBS 112371]